MFLERVRAKGNYYLYLKAYSVRSNYAKPYVTVYKFGRVERALKNMKAWKNDFNSFPGELKELGLNKKDLDSWIRAIESGSTTKTVIKNDNSIRERETFLKECFGTQVKIKHSKNKGKIEIEFMSKDELDRILEKFVI